MLLFIAFFALRATSYLTYSHSIWQSIICLALVVGLITAFYFDQSLAFIIILAELLFGGTGGFLQFFNFSLRNLLIIVYLILFFGGKLLAGEKFDSRLLGNDNEKKDWRLLAALVVWLGFTVINGYLAKNSLTLIMRDASSFVLLFLLLPAIEFVRKFKFDKKYLAWLEIFLWAEVVWTGFNFILFRSGLASLHDQYYNWVRLLGAAKLTQVSWFCWRVIFSEHLLVVPIMLVFTALWLKTKNKHYLWPMLAGTIILALNLSRAYLLGWLFGLIILKIFCTWRDWLSTTIAGLAVFFAIFIAINLTSSFGQFAGLDLLGLRFIDALWQAAGVHLASTPQLDVSVDIRGNLLAPIWQLIKTAPLFGHGLGIELTYQELGKTLQTDQFDWGYFEMLAKWGLIGCALFLTVIVQLIIKLYKKITLEPKNLLWPGLFAAWLAFGTINFTAPAFVHVLGVFFLVVSLALTAKQPPTN